MVKSILRTKNITTSITLSAFKLHYKAMVAKNQNKKNQYSTGIKYIHRPVKENKEPRTEFQY